MPKMNIEKLGNKESLLRAEEVLDKIKKSTVSEVVLSREDYILVMEAYIEMFKHVSTCSRKKLLL